MLWHPDERSVLPFISVFIALRTYFQGGMMGVFGEDGELGNSARAARLVMAAGEERISQLRQEVNREPAQAHKQIVARAWVKRVTC